MHQTAVSQVCRARELADSARQQYPPLAHVLRLRTACALAFQVPLAASARVLKALCNSSIADRAEMHVDVAVLHWYCAGTARQPASKPGSSKPQPSRRKPGQKLAAGARAKAAGGRRSSSGGSAGSTRSLANLLYGSRWRVDGGVRQQQEEDMAARHTCGESSRWAKLRADSEQHALTNNGLPCCITCTASNSLAQLCFRGDPVALRLHC